MIIYGEKLKKKHIPANERFIEVRGEDGKFYDLTPVTQAKEHIKGLCEEGYQARVVRRSEVPPCRIRICDPCLGDAYLEVSLDGGEQFYFED